MKKNIQIPLTLLAVIALATSRAFAHPEGHETELPPPPPAQEHRHEHSTKVPTSVAETLAEIQRQHGLLTKTVADKKLEDAHDHAFAIRDLVQSLVSKVPEAKKKDIEVVAEEAAELAADIDKSSAAGAQKTTEASVKALGSTIKTLHLILPHDHS